MNLSLIATLCLRLRAPLLLLALHALTSVHAQPPSDALQTACSQADFQTILGAAATPTSHAQAVWVNRKHLLWPGRSGSATYKLYQSEQAALQLAGDGRVQGFDARVPLTVLTTPLPGAQTARFRYLEAGVTLRVERPDAGRLPRLLQGQVWLTQEDAQGHVLQHTETQMAGALDDWYAAQAQGVTLGAQVQANASTYRLWAPTAQAVYLCRYGQPDAPAVAVQPLQRDHRTGVWQYRHKGALHSPYYRYLVDVYVPGVGRVRNRVTDPYSVSLGADSRRSYAVSLDDPRTKPPDWDGHRTPHTVDHPVDLRIYELHVRDFSISDTTVPAGHRGKYLAFTDSDANGMRHLRALAGAGMTDVHLLPVFDIATVAEQACISPVIDPPAQGDSELPQARVAETAASDCFNWGYDPLHYNAPEGSYASDANDPLARIRELRAMVMALHRSGLRVGMDVVYNHTAASGQNEKSVLDRIVPGYYHRLDAKGQVEHSTCCDNTATEHRMMGKLMLDSVVQWARAYRMDSFRFDLMGHQPRALMEQLQARLRTAVGRPIPLIGEGWNFGEVANGTRFVQASQLSLQGSGIGTFSDRARDAIRGGGAGDNGDAQVRNQGYINGLVYDRNALSQATPEDLLRTADRVRVGLAGTQRSYRMQTHDGVQKALAEIDYAGQGAGYASEPAEVVNYVENHDNQTLYDSNMFKLPPQTSTRERTRVQLLGLAITMFSQGIAYFHAGSELLRSKSMDRNSYDSGDWFNRLDWSYQTNYFGTGLPPKADNGSSWDLMRPLLADPAHRPTPDDIALARGIFLDLLRVRASTTLLRLRSSADIRQRLQFLNTGPTQTATVLVGHLAGQGYPGARYKDLLYLVNVDTVAHEVVLPQQAGKSYRLHPVLASARAADHAMLQQASTHTASGTFRIPARTSVVYVVQ